MTDFGTVFLRGRTWWIQFCHRGKVYRESAHSQIKEDAKNPLRDRLAEISAGRVASLRRTETSFEDLASMMENDYEVNARKSAADLSYRIGHLREAFGGQLADEITHERMVRYILARKAQHRRRSSTSSRVFRRC